MRFTAWWKIVYDSMKIFYPSYTLFSDLNVQNAIQGKNADFAEPGRYYEEIL